MAILAALLSLALAPLGPVSKQNTTAESVGRLSLELGIDFDHENAKAEHPTKEARESPGRPAVGTWLEAELTRDDDAISEPPVPAREFLKTHRDAIGGIVSALEKASPQWGDGDAVEGNGLAVWTNRLVPTVLLSRILVGAALVEERDGHGLEADRALEASWSLLQPLSKSPDVMSHLLSVAISRFQAGALRRQKTASLVWMGRLTADDPYRAMIEAVQGDRWKDPSGLTNRYGDAYFEARKTALDAIGRMSPCESAGMSEEDVKKLTSAALSGLSFEDRQITEILAGIAMPNLISAVHRAGRLAVDRELTLQVLRLRLAKEGAKDGKWPSELGDPWSEVCPGVAYRYKTDGISVDIQFGAAVDAGTDRVLPLSFHSGKSRILPTLTPAPTPTPTPVPPDEP